MLTIHFVYLLCLLLVWFAVIYFSISFCQAAETLRGVINMHSAGARKQKMLNLLSVQEQTSHDAG